MLELGDAWEETQAVLQENNVFLKKDFHLTGQVVLRLMVGLQIA